MHERTSRGVRILIIDDEVEIRRAMRTHLTGEGYTVESAATAKAGIEAINRWHPDVVILDLSLPDGDGIAYLRQWREWTAVPIIVLSARTKEEDKVKALDAGADDYIAKPFSPSELVARIRVALRHAAHAAGGAGNDARFQTGELAIDMQKRQVLVDGQEKRLTPTEYAVLTYLATNAGRVITHRALLLAVWGPAYEDEQHYLHVFIRQLRQKIEPDPRHPRYLLTDTGIGYHLLSPGDDLSANS